MRVNRERGTERKVRFQQAKGKRKQVREGKRKQVRVRGWFYGKTEAGSGKRLGKRKQVRVRGWFYWLKWENGSRFG